MLVTPTDFTPSKSVDCRSRDWLKRLRLGIFVMSAWAGMSAAALALENEINGIWSGVYCGNSSTTFQINTRNPSASWVRERWCNAFSCGDLDFRITEIDRAQRTLLVRAYQGTGWSVTGFSIRFRLSADGRSMRGEYFGHPRCTNSQLTKQANETNSGPVFRSSVAALPAPRQTSQSVVAAPVAPAAPSAPAPPSLAARLAAQFAPLVPGALPQVPRALRPPPRNPGPPRGDLAMPADASRAAFYHMCAAAADILAERATASGTPIRVMSASLTSQDLRGLRTQFITTAGFMAPNINSAPRAVDSQVRAGIESSEVGRTSDDLGRFLGVCIASGARDLDEGAVRFQRALSASSGR